MNHTISTFAPHDLFELFVISREEKNCEKVTLRNYHTAIGHFLKHCPADLSRLEPAHLLLWLKALRMEGKTDANRAWYQRHVWAFVRWLYVSGHVERDPRRGVSKVMVEQTRRPQVTEETMMRLLAVAMARRNRYGDPMLNYYRDIAVLRVLWATGVRRRELAAITLDAVNLETREIFIPHAKGKKLRTVPYDFATKKAIMEFLVLERGREPGNLFGMTENAIYLMVKRTAIRAGVPAFPHAFRSGFARRVRRMGVDLGDTATLLGHSQLTMTRHYSQVGEEEAAINSYREKIG